MVAKASILEGLDPFMVGGLDLHFVCEVHKPWHCSKSKLKLVGKSVFYQLHWVCQLSFLRP